MSSLLSEELNTLKGGKINWVGFYLTRGDQLVLGPFQGKVACIRINFGKGKKKNGKEKVDKQEQEKKPEKHNRKRKKISLPLNIPCFLDSF